MKKTIEYECIECGYKTSKWNGKCPKCQKFNTFQEIEYQDPIVTDNPAMQLKNVTKTERFKDVLCQDEERILTGLNEFDRVMGGGIVKDSITILSAKPGAGKSTLCIQICDYLAKQGLTVLYASGEESKTQIKNRSKRLNLKNIDNVWISNNTNLNAVVNDIEEKDADFVVIDSIQTFYLNEFLPSTEGNIKQVNECAKVLRNIAKNPNRPRMIMLIGQMTKEDELAGSRALEHLVDTYIQIDTADDDTLRTLFAIKNRYGNVGEMGFFNMENDGLQSIDNPSEYFMTERNDAVIGSALTVIKEGTRPIICEVESLTSQSYTPYPSRIGEALKRDQLNILVSILEQRAKVNLYNKNVVIKTTGGIKLKEQNSNLAVLMSIVSSFYAKEIPNSYVYIADVGLTGELKKVPNLDMRIKELDRMNYEKVFIAPTNAKLPKTTKLKVVQCHTLLDVIKETFGSYKPQ